MSLGKYAKAFAKAFVFHLPGYVIVGITFTLTSIFLWKNYVRIIFVWVGVVIGLLAASCGETRVRVVEAEIIEAIEAIEEIEEVEAEIVENPEDIDVEER